MTASWPRWLRYLIAVPLALVWLMASSAAVPSSAVLALLCGADASTAVGCGVATFAVAMVCTWLLRDELVEWSEGGTS